jgi:hypothetical protein
VRTASAGVLRNLTFTIEWRNVALAAGPTKRIIFEVILNQNGSIVFNYADLDDDTERGAWPIVGPESHGGSGLQYSHHDPVLANGRAVVFRYPTTRERAYRIRYSGAGDPLTEFWGHGAVAMIWLRSGDPAARTLQDAQVYEERLGDNRIVSLLTLARSLDREQAHAPAEAQSKASPT